MQWDALWYKSNRKWSKGKKKEKLQTFGSCMGYHANAMLNAKKASVPDISQS